MLTSYIVQDERGNVGQTIPLTQGETRLVSVYLFLKNGLPRIIPGTISTAVIKILQIPNQTSIQKTLAADQVTLISQAGVNPGTIGFQFQLATSDTQGMAANNAGLPMIATLTDSTGNVYEYDFLQVFAVEVPAVLT